MAGFVVLAVAAGISARSLISSDQAVAHTLMISQHLGNLRDALQDAEVQRREYARTGDEQYRKRCDELLKEINSQRHDIAGSTADYFNEKSQLARLDAVLRRLARFYDESLSRTNQLQGDAAAQLKYVFTGRALTDETRAIIGEMMQAENQLLKIRSDRASQIGYQTLVVIAVDGLVSVLIVGLALALNRRHLTRRDQAESSLRNSQALYSSLVDHLPGGLFRKDTVGRYVYVSQAFCDLKQVKSEEILGRTAGEVAALLQTSTPTGERADSANYQMMLAGEKHHAAIMATGRKIEVDEIYPMADGQNKYYHILKTPVFDGQNNPAGSQGIMFDITERKRAEEEARRSEARLDFALKIVHTGAWVMDLGSQKASHRTLIHDQIFGYQTLLPEWGYEQFMEHVLPEDRPEVVRHFREALTAQTDWNCECRIRRADGEVRWIFAAGTHQRDAAGKAVRLAGIVQDITERKQAEEASHRLVAIVQSSDDAIIGKSLEGVITSWNPGAQKIFGYTEAEMVGQPLLKRLVPPELLHEEPEILARIKRGESVEHFESVRIRKDGRKIDVALTISPVRNAKGIIIGASKIARDITERKRAEEDLRISERHYRRLFEAAMDGILILEADTGAVVDVNPFLIKMLELPRTKILGKKIWELGFFNDITANHAKFLELQQRGHVRYEDLPLETASGQRMDVEFVSNIYPVNSHQVIQCNIRDVTQRQRMESDLRESEQKYRTLFETARDAVFLLKEDRWVDCNPRALDMFGCPSREDILGHSPDQFSPPCQPDDRDSRELVIEKTTAALAGQPQFFEWLHTRCDGTTFPAEVSLNTVKLKDTLLVQAIVRDITERKGNEIKNRKWNAELEQRVRDRTAELTLVNKELEAFSYSISHDLRAPLRSIDGFSRILLEDCIGQLNIANQEYFQRIRAASQRMSQLIDGLLQLSQFTRSEMRRAPVDLSALARAVADDLQQAEPNRRVEFFIAPNLNAEGDANLLRAALENLLGNAWKFSSKQSAAKIEFGVTTRDGAPAYFVRDNGVGFNMAYASKLFGAFQRLHSATEFVGTGIGLATVQRIIHRHNGRVWAESEQDHGATFYFTLPRSTN